MNRGGSFLVEPVDRGSVFSRELFTEEHTMFGEAVRDFCSSQILPVAAEMAVFNTELTRTIFTQMGELGFLGVDFPEEYVGLNQDKVSTCLVVESLMAGGSASIAVTFTDHSGIGTLPIIWYGSKAQKEKFLPKLASGEWMGSFALTESDAGSDVLSGKVTARLSEDGTHYILNGTKIYVTNGTWADVCLTFAQVDGHKYTAFILDKDCPGWVVGPEEHKMGIKGSSTCTYFFEDCRVPVENMLGKVGQGTAIALNVLYTGRYKLGASTTGGSKLCLKLALDFAFEREQFHRPIADFGMIQRKFADMMVGSWEADGIIYMTAGSIDRVMAEIPSSRPDYFEILQKVIADHGIEASLSKIAGSEVLAYNVDEAVQIYGGAGYIEDYPIAAIYRDERINRIFEGTNEINRIIIAGTVLKKAILEEIPIREMILEREHNWIPDLNLPDTHPLIEEARVIEFSRSLVLHILNQLILAYGQDLKNQQWALEPLADMILALAVMDTGFKRLKNLPDDYQHQQAVTLIHRISVSRQFQEMLKDAGSILGQLFEGEKLAAEMQLLDKRRMQLKYYPRTVIWKQELVEILYHHKTYFLD